VQKVAVPVGVGGGGHGVIGGIGGIGARAIEGHQRGRLAPHGAPQQHHRVDAHQHAFLVGVAVAGAGAAVRNLAQHRAGVALDLGRAHALVARRRLAEGAGFGKHGHVHAGEAICLGVFSHRGDLVGRVGHE
jgi:hypothetical protein